MRRRTAAWNSAWLAFAMTGCGDPATDGSADRLGVRWTIVEELRIGEDDGPKQFGQLKGLVALGDGRFALLDSQAREVRVFDEDGSHVTTHGRRGEGPGEMEFPNGLMLDPSGLLWVPDVSNARMSLFHPDSGFVRSLRYASTLTQWVWSGAMGADGRVFGPAIAAEDQAALLVVHDSAMVALDTLPLEEASTWAEGSYCWSPSEGATNCANVPFYAQEVRFVDPDGHAWERGSGVVRYRIRKWLPGGDTVLVVTGDRQPLPVATAERDSAIAELRERLGDQADLDWSKIPSAKPIVQSLFMSHEGNLWVRFASPDHQAAFDVWAPDGTYLGEAVTDLRVHMREVAPVVRGDQMWFVATDELDTEYVVRARLRETEER